MPPASVSPGSLQSAFYIPVQCLRPSPVPQQTVIEAGIYDSSQYSFCYRGIILGASGAFRGFDSALMWLVVASQTHDIVISINNPSLPGPSPLDHFFSPHVDIF